MSLRIFTLALCLVGVAAPTPLYANEDTDSDTQRLKRGLEYAKAGDYEKARTAFRSALELDDDVDRRACQAAASVMLLCGEAGLAADLLQPWLQDAVNLLDVMEFQEMDEARIKEMESTKEKWEALIAGYRKTAVREEKIRKDLAPKYVAWIVRNVTHHRRSITTKILQLDEEEKGYLLKDEFETFRWIAGALVAEDGRSVTHRSTEYWLGRDAAWARFDEVLKLLKAQAGNWKRAFAESKTWPDVECEAWIPPKLPFPEGGANVLRRVEFRWTSEKGEAPPSEPIATLSLLRPAFELEDGSTTFGGMYVLKLVLNSEGLR